MSKENGVIYRISGPVVTAVGISPRMYEVVRVGDEGLMGEVIELHGDQSVIQVYEETSGSQAEFANNWDATHDDPRVAFLGSMVGLDLRAVF